MYLWSLFLLLFLSSPRQRSFHTGAVILPRSVPRRGLSRTRTTLRAFGGLLRLRGAAHQLVLVPQPCLVWDSPTARCSLLVPHCCWPVALPACAAISCCISCFSRDLRFLTPQLEVLLPASRCHSPIQPMLRITQGYPWGGRAVPASGLWHCWGAAVPWEDGRTEQLSQLLHSHPLGLEVPADLWG